MADDPAEPAPGEGWIEFKDGKAMPEEGKTQRDVAPRLIVALLAFAVAIIFVAQNRNRVETSFLIFDGHPRLWVVIVASVLLGALLGQAVGVLRRRRKKPD